jgi:hypothetical protein
MGNPLAFMTPRHHAVRNFVVLELPRNQGRPLRPAQIAAALRLEPSLIIQLLDDLEKHLFFLVRDRRGDVSWAFPVASDRTPHRLRFSTGERIFAACGEDSIATPFVQARLRKQQPFEVEIETSCAHCGRALHILVDDELRVRVRETQANPRVFLPKIDWATFRGANIINDY